MKTEKLNYNLPSELIAQQPTDERGGSRLLICGRSSGELSDSNFSEIGDYLSAGDCLVLNDTKVLPARFFGRRGSGGKLEGLFLNELDGGIWEVMIKGAGKLKIGEVIYLRNKAKEDYCKAEVVEKLEGGKCHLAVDSQGDVESILGRIGFAPLPPYIKRDDNIDLAESDSIRYQTVYARRSGAVAAPTAGLHFTEGLLEELKGRGVRFAFVTLHVGAGTFKPITAEDIEGHEIQQEWFSIDEKNAQIINSAKDNGGRIVAVGTTAVRTLETVSEGSHVHAAKGATKLFIKPGYEFKIVDAMVTNFHLPKSSLLALVGAFAGLENILAAYEHAIELRYRFYSYGDAMLIK